MTLRSSGRYYAVVETGDINTDNAFIESFNRRFWQEYLNENWFLPLEDVRL
ncbi:integrase core domain-containing protein [Chloroflexota bacterium]